MATGRETQLSIDKARKDYPDGVVEKVEHWKHYPVKGRPGLKKVRRDLLGVADILVVDPEEGFILIQVTTRKQMSVHRTKMMGKPQPSDKNPEKFAAYRRKSISCVLKAGGRIIIQGWEQPKGKGTRYELTEWEITEETLEKYNYED